MRRLFSISICTFLALVAIGCHSTNLDNSKAEEQKASKIAQQSGSKLYSEYLVAGTNQVGAILKEMVRLGEVSKFSESERATWLYLAYSRFYAFEKRRGDQTLADSYFERARYWLYRRHEIARDTKEDADASLASFTPDKCIQSVDNWDKSYTDGRGAQYLHE